MFKITRFLREYFRRGSFPVVRTETRYHREGEDLDASVYSLPGKKRRPGWVVLHGLTGPGKDHPSLERFARALAATDAVVMTPDIPEWRNLRVATTMTVPTIRSAIRSLAEHPAVTGDRVGLIGFSFGATQGMVAASDPALESTLQGVAAWGGYRDVHRLCRFGTTGEHDLDGVAYTIPRDPYGSWILGADFLTGVPGMEAYHDVAAALRELAVEAGRRRIYAWDPSYDPDKLRLRETIAEPHRDVYDLFASPAGQPPHDLDRAREIANGLGDAALRVQPLLDPGPCLRRFRTRTLVAHGRHDRLVPFTESLRLARELQPDVLARCTITGLFAHSGGTEKGLGPWGLSLEGTRFVALLNSIIRLI
jgi:pimeloyl-ACP methyl ester carboxylesterase